MEKLNAAVNMHFSIISLFFYCPKFKKKKKKPTLGVALGFVTSPEGCSGLLCINDI